LRHPVEPVVLVADGLAVALAQRSAVAGGIIPGMLPAARAYLAASPD
jgi:hypothetical protein